MSEIQNAFQKLKEEYEAVFSNAENRSKHCPNKVVHHLAFSDGISVARKSYMEGITTSGRYAIKSIYVNDVTNEYMEKVKLYEDDSKEVLLDVFENKGVTTYRCGLMTCVSIAVAASNINLQEIKRVGFIGCGRTNLANCFAISNVFGVDSCVIRGSERNRGKNKDKFEQICKEVVVDDTDTFEHINDCDVVVVCTSSYLEKDLVSVKDISKPRLIISLDCGYYLDESFRIECNSYTDSIEQIVAEYEHDFHFDKQKHKIHQLLEENVFEKDRTVVYLHGVGFADAVVAEMVYAGGVTL